MKNRMLEPYKNGKFFCWHDWEVAEDVGIDWDLRIGIKIVCKCKKCGKLKSIRSYLIKEVPDDKINHNIRYH
jgi:hypothetical protein